MDQTHERMNGIEIFAQPLTDAQAHLQILPSLLVMAHGDA